MSIPSSTKSESNFEISHLEAGVVGHRLERDVDCARGFDEAELAGRDAAPSHALPVQADQVQFQLECPLAVNIRMSNGRARHAEVDGQTSY